MQGNYFHANPKYYKPNDTIKISHKEILAEDIWKNDKNKEILAQKYNYPLLIIWEDDFVNMTDSEIIIKIRENL